jgi:hypothetical protein
MLAVLHERGESARRRLGDAREFFDGKRCFAGNAVAEGVLQTVGQMRYEIRAHVRGR